MFSNYQRKAAVVIAVLCSASIAVAGVVRDGQHWLVWPSGGAAMLLLVALSLWPMPPRVGAVLFILSALNGVVFLTASKLGLPASLPVWGWFILAFAMAIVGLLEDAERIQSQPRNRL